MTEEADLFADTLSELLPEEAASIPKAREARLLEFRAGRHCARRALSRLGAPAMPVLRTEDRAPVWPAGFVGSITHTRDSTRGWCGAAVARASEVRSIGLDAELDEPIERALFRRVLTPAEREWIASAPESEQGMLARLVFSAKECTYKCQYPLSHQFLEFADVELLTPLGDATFSAVLLKDAPPFSAGQVFAGRYQRRDGFIVTSITLLRP